MDAGAAADGEVWIACFDMGSRHYCGGVFAYRPGERAPPRRKGFDSSVLRKESVRVVSWRLIDLITDTVLAQYDRAGAGDVPTQVVRAAPGAVSKEECVTPVCCCPTRVQVLGGAVGGHLRDAGRPAGCVGPAVRAARARLH